MNWFDKIDDYYYNRLSPEENSAFEEALEKDDGLRQKLEELAQRDRDEYVKNIWRRLVEEDEQKRRKKCIRRCKLIIISILMMVFALAVWYFFK